MENRQIVIVRGFGDEPSQLQAYVEDESVMVFRESPDAAIPYPRTFLYEWDDALFSELREAFQRKNPDELASLWARARYYTPQPSGPLAHL